MDKRYQVFVSSTYEDLQKERQEVMQALLELDCIPSGMELFPAANEDQWTLIKKVIDDCDYYLVIVGGRYGSTGTDGISFTEMEYRYALEKNKPVVGFLHKDPGLLPSNRCEQNPDGKLKLETFRNLVQKKMVKFWNSPTDLGSVVSRSLIKLIKQSPAIGWVRADRLPSESASEEILKLRHHIEELEASLAATTYSAPETVRHLSQGDDLFTINLEFELYETDSYRTERYSSAIKASWYQIFSAASPIMIHEASDSEFKRTLDNFVKDQTLSILASGKKFKGQHLKNFKINEIDFQTIKVQLRAIGLITKSTKQRSIKDISTYWTLTPYGDNIMTQLRAIKRNEKPNASETKILDQPQLISETKDILERPPF